MDNFAKILGAISILSLPLTGVFAIGRFFNLSFVCAFLSAFFLILNNVNFEKKILLKFCFIPTVLLITCSLNFFLPTYIYNTETTFTYITIRQLIFLLTYSFCIHIIFIALPLKSILYYAYIGLLISALYGISDCILFNLFRFNFDNYVYRYTLETNTGAFMGFFRNRSFFAEPGLYSLYINILSPFAILYISKVRGKFRKFFFNTITIITFVLTLSVAGFVVFLLIIFFINFNLLIKNNLKIYSLFIIILSILYFSKIQFIEYMFDSFTLSTISGKDRLVRLYFVKDTILNSFDKPLNLLFGHGPGWIRSNYAAGGVVNSYAELFIEYGFFCLILIIAFYVSLYTKVKKANNKLLKFVYFAIPFQLCFTAEYSHCFVFFSLNLMIFISNKLVAGNQLRVNDLKY